MIFSGHSEFPFGIKPSENSFFNNLSLTLMKDCLNDDKKIMSLEQWCLSVGIYPQDLHQYRTQDETFDKSVRVAMTAISERRERRIEDASPQGLMFIQPQFSERWEREYDRRQKVKANLEKSDKIIVEVHPIPPTDIVKHVSTRSAQIEEEIE